ncbi:MAG TPA: gluconeogenesis factor YvcK family protein [Candidatus Saccharimonadales bacterium]|nr:gluconeogenesis factor YvcK family protein [Candidatus Saccharimonadales bacterium]
MKNNKKIVCLGGGIGSVNLIKGLHEFTSHIATVISLADDGGSAGRLRRLYNTYPLGDIVSCIAALSDKKDPFISDLLTYRFPGDRYAKDTHLEGHKVGNLVLFAMLQLTGNMADAIDRFKQLFKVAGEFLPATNDVVSLSAETIDGKEIFGEEKIDLGKYQGKKILEKITLHPANVKANQQVIKAIQEADALIFGPGDLYTNILPVMVVPEIAEAIKKADAKKFFVVNIANKPFETRNYSAADFVKAVEKHIGSFPFNYLVVNSNFSVHIPKKYRYTYVKYKKDVFPQNTQLIQEDLVNSDFPLYHDSNKLAKVIIQHI